MVAITAAAKTDFAPQPHSVLVASIRLPSQVSPKPTAKTQSGKPITNNCWERSFSRAKEFKVFIGCQTKPRVFLTSK